MPNLVHQYL